MPLDGNLHQYRCEDLKPAQSLCAVLSTVKVKQSLYSPWGILEVEAPKLHSSRHMKVPSPTENIPGTHFCYTLSRSQDHSAAGKTMLMKNSIDTIGHRNRIFPACSAVPEPTAPCSALCHSVCWSSVQDCKGSVPITGAVIAETSAVKVEEGYSWRLFAFDIRYRVA